MTDSKEILYVLFGVAIVIFAALLFVVPEKRAILWAILILIIIFASILFYYLNPNRK